MSHVETMDHLGTSMKKGKSVEIVESVGGLRRRIYIGLGVVCVALGAVGAVVPGLPTTVFLIIASWFFTRSSPALNRRLLGHPKFGPPLRRFLEERSMPPQAKAKCLISMWTGITVASLFLLGAPPSIRIIVISAGVVGTAAILFWVKTTR